VVAQIAKEFGFERIQHSAVESLSDILQRYIEQIGHSSHLFAELAGRTESNFNDVRRSLSDAGVSLDDLYMFASVAEEIPFAKAIPEFPVKKEKKQEANGIANSSDNNNNNNNPNTSQPAYIPNCLPSFPDSHTYINTPVYEERLTDSRQIRKNKSKEKRHIETSLAKLNESLGNKPIVNYDTARKENPYLVAPRQKHVASDRNDTDKMDTSASITPTPIQKESPYLRNVIVRKGTDPQLDMDDSTKKVYTELEESERMRKRQKAEQILALKYDGDVIDHELPSLKTNLDVPRTPSSTIPSPLPPNNSGMFPFVERL